MIRSAACVIAFACVAQPAAAQTARCDNCGTIESIERTVVKQTWAPLGSIPPSSVSGDLGGDPGRTSTAMSIGKGGTSKGMVTIGAAGGVPYARKPNDPRVARWEIVVKMDAGGTRSVQQGYEPALHEGDRVRVFGNQLELVQP